MNRVVIHIDRLVLHGVDPADAQAVSEGVRAELQRLLADPDAAEALSAGGDRPRISAAPVRLATGSAGASTGRRVAASVANSIMSRGKP